MNVNYWECEHCNSDSIATGDEESFTYEEYFIHGCASPHRKHDDCRLENKWCDDEADCKLLDVIATDRGIH